MEIEKKEIIIEENKSIPKKENINEIGKVEIIKKKKDVKTEPKKDNINNNKKEEIIKKY